MTLWSDALWAAIQDEGIKGFADPIPVEEIAFDHETTVAPGAPPSLGATMRRPADPSTVSRYGLYARPAWASISSIAMSTIE